MSLNTYSIDTGNSSVIKVNGSQSVSYVLNTPLTIVRRDKQYVLRVVDGYIPYTYYNITDTNNKLVVVESNEDGSNPQVPYTIEMTLGNYQMLYSDSDTRNANEFCYALQQELNSGSVYGITYLVSLNLINHKIVISTATLDKKSKFTLSTSSPYRILGSSIGDHEMTTTTDLTFENVGNLYPRKMLYIHTNLEIQNNTSNSLLSINPRVRPYAFINLPKRNMLIEDITISHIDLQLVNVDGELIDLNGNDWSINIEIQEVDREITGGVNKDTRMMNDFEFIIRKQTDDLTTVLGNVVAMMKLKK
jgi:hypothetical protein